MIQPVFFMWYRGFFTLLVLGGHPNTTEGALDTNCMVAMYLGKGLSTIVDR